MQVVIEAGFGRLLGGKTAAVVEPTLDNEDVESSLGEIGAEHEAVMAGANDDAIVVALEDVHVSLSFCRSALARSFSRPHAGSEKYRILCAKASGRKARDEALQRVRALVARARVFIAQRGHP